MVGWILFSCAVTAADLYLRRRARSKKPQRTFCNGFVEETELQNSGLLFGFGAKYRQLTKFLPCLAWVLMLLAFLLEKAIRGPLFCLLLGGGANLTERLRRGSVTDYIRFPRLPGRAGRLVWNFSDFLLLFSAVTAVIRILRKP